MKKGGGFCEMMRGCSVREMAACKGMVATTTCEGDERWKEMER